MRLSPPAAFVPALLVAAVLAPVLLVAGCDDAGGGNPFPNLRPQGTWERRDSIAVNTASGTQHVVFEQVLTLTGASTAMTGTLATRRLDTRPITPPRALENASVTGSFNGFSIALALAYAPSGRSEQWAGTVAFSNTFMTFTASPDNRAVGFTRRSN